jgi:hypothetical protein
MRKITRLGGALAFCIILHGLNGFAENLMVDELSYLFKIGRSKDSNEIYYQANTTASGDLDSTDPVSIYWIKFSKNSEREPLTWIQNQYAYGLKFLKTTSQEAIFQFVSYPHRTFVLRKSEKGEFRVFNTNPNGIDMEVERIFIQIDGGTFWFPKISRVELHGKTSGAGNLFVETVVPK